VLSIGGVPSSALNGTQSLGASASAGTASAVQGVSRAEGVPRRLLPSGLRPDDGVNIREYLQNVSPVHAALLRAELDVLFTFGLDEDQMFALVRNHGCDWSATARGLTTTDWPRSVRERLN
jgi:hypothetical protein